MTGFSKAFHFLLDIVKAEIAKYYLRAIDRVRQIFIAGLVAIFCLILVMSGFLLIHFALFIYLPWSLSTKALILLILGLVYFFVPLGLVYFGCSKRRWVKLSGADEFVGRLSMKEDQ